VIVTLAANTERGEGNFNFTANFACPPLIPYFPAGYNNASTGECFAIGLEHPELLYNVLAPLKLGEVAPADRSGAWAAAATTLKAAIEVHTVPLVAAARVLEAETGVRFAGLDSSAAPSKETVSMCKVFECLGVPFFGASGTVEAAAFLTRVFKATSGVDLIGFSGLMLTCLEDEGAVLFPQSTPLYNQLQLIGFLARALCSVSFLYRSRRWVNGCTHISCGIQVSIHVYGRITHVCGQITVPLALVIHSTLTDATLCCHHHTHTQGMASGAAAGQYDIRALLQYVASPFYYSLLFATPSQG
jgi:hypothetical protein